VSPSSVFLIKKDRSYRNETVLFMAQAIGSKVATPFKDGAESAQASNKFRWQDQEGEVEKVEGDSGAKVQAAWKEMGLNVSSHEWQSWAWLLA
jgi:hypothetical protein